MKKTDLVLLPLIHHDHHNWRGLWSLDLVDDDSNVGELEAQAIVAS